MFGSGQVSASAHTRKRTRFEADCSRQNTDAPKTGGRQCNAQGRAQRSRQRTRFAFDSAMTCSTAAGVRARSSLRESSRNLRMAGTECGNVIPQPLVCSSQITRVQGNYNAAAMCVDATECHQTLLQRDVHSSGYTLNSLRYSRSPGRRASAASNPRPRSPCRRRPAESRGRSARGCPADRSARAGA